MGGEGPLILLTSSIHIAGGMHLILLLSSGMVHSSERLEMQCMKAATYIYVPSFSLLQ